MHKARDKHLKQRHSRSLYAKELVRRAHAHCELCAAAGQTLSTYEVPPVEVQADFSRCILVCEVCRQALEGMAEPDPHYWHCLADTVWSKVPAAKCTGVYLLQQLANEHTWARDLLEQVYLTPHEKYLLNTIVLPQDSSAS